MTGADAHATWTDVLSDYAARLDAVVGSLDGGSADEVPSFVPPRDLPPLPSAHRRWAEDLLRQSAALEQLVGQRLSRLTSSRGPQEGTPRFVDALT